MDKHCFQLVYPVGNIPYAPTWFSLESGGTALTPAEKILYIVVDSNSDYYGQIYSFNKTTHFYEDVFIYAGSVSAASTPSVMMGATKSTDGVKGLAPQPHAGEHNKVLYGDGKYHSFSTADSFTVIAYIADASYIGETVTLTDGVTSLTEVLDASHEAVFTNVTMKGFVTLSCTHSDAKLIGTANLSMKGNY